MAVIPALARQTLEDSDFGTSLGYKRNPREKLFILLFFFRKLISPTNLVFCDIVPIDCISYNF